MVKSPVLILGAASEVGKALARQFAAAGHPLHLALREPDRLSPLCAEISAAHGVTATRHDFDVTRTTGFPGFFADLEPRPRIVISVVGLLGEQAATEGDPEAVRAIVETNFTGPALALETAARALAEDGERATIIGISSVAGDRGRAKNYWYGAAKAGLTTALSGLRQKYARSGLTVITVKPGFIDTPMTAGMELPGFLVASPDEVAGRIFHAWRRGTPVIYGWKWWLVMRIIRALPERIFMNTRF
ncbi:MAG: SDR family NAD(P)-dependent oxidoreductase [Paracoccaceae bacterium]